MNVLYGLHQPDEGEILLDGEAGRDPAPPAGPSRLGIGMVHQHFMLVPVMTVAENLVLGAEPQEGPAAGLQDGGRAHARALEALRPGGRPGRPRRRTSAWAPSSGWRSCARCSAARRCSCSTSRPRCSPPRRPRTCSRSCATLKAEGTGIIFISHKLNEVLDVADRITVLRRGEKVDTVPREGATERSLAHADGRPRRAAARREGRHKPGEPLLSLEGVVGARRPRPARRARRQPGRARGRDRRARRHRRQRPERADRDDHGPAQARRGHDHVAGRDVTHAGPRDTLAAGVSHIAEDRHRRGLVLEFDLAENLALREYKTPAFSQARLPLAEEDGRPRAQAAARSSTSAAATRRPAPARCRAATSRRS